MARENSHKLLDYKMSKLGGRKVMFKRIVAVLSIFSFFVLVGTAYSDVRFKGKITIDDGQTYEGEILGRTPHGDDYLSFEHHGNAVNVKLENIKTIKKKSKSEYVIEVSSGKKFTVSPKKENIYSTFGSLSVMGDLGTVHIKPERIVEILIVH